MKNFIQPGEMIDVVASAAVSSGDVVVLEDLVGIAAADAAIGESFAMALEGVFELPKDGNAIDAGVKVNWHAASGHIQEAGGAGTHAIGYCVKSALAGEAKVKVLLHKF
jgi:predicted RecA/RadA family phage recombinase